MTSSNTSKRPISNQRHVTYKRREVDKFYQMEETLMNEHCVTYSDLVKRAICKMYNECKLLKVGSSL